jgi:hypothetical protein
VWRNFASGLAGTYVEVLDFDFDFPMLECDVSTLSSYFLGKIDF